MRRRRSGSRRSGAKRSGDSGSKSRMKRTSSWKKTGSESWTGSKGLGGKNAEIRQLWSGRPWSERASPGTKVCQKPATTSQTGESICICILDQQTATENDDWLATPVEVEVEVLRAKRRSSESCPGRRLRIQSARQERIRATGRLGDLRFERRRGEVGPAGQNGLVKT